MTNPSCGGSHSVPVSEGASFFCHPSLKGRYVTIRNLKNDVVLTLCEVEVYAERRGMMSILYYMYMNMYVKLYAMYS